MNSQQLTPADTSFIGDEQPMEKEELTKFYRQLSTSSNFRLNTDRAETTTGIALYSGTWSSTEIVHLLKRSLYGITYANFIEFRDLSLKDAVDKLINEDDNPLPPINNYEVNDIFDPHVSFGETWITAPNGENQIKTRRNYSLLGWLNKNIIDQPTTIHEKMIQFWHNLIPIEVWGVNQPKMSYQYYMTLRQHALGNYKELIKAITFDPAMLKYLNGNSNQKWSPDENYARELQELFTVGKGKDSGYTETDVQEAARVLTGFKYISNQNANKPATTYFNVGHHDTEDKQFSSFYGNKVIKGSEDGYAEVNELIDMILDTDEVAKYICRRLYIHFVYSEVSTSAETNVIEPLAAIFRANNYDIKPVLKALLESEHFYDAANRGAVIKNPLDHLSSFWKMGQIPHLDDNDELLKYFTYLRLYSQYQVPTGMPMGDPPNVAGYPAYYQTPAFDKLWISTVSITKRVEIVERIINGRLWIVKLTDTARYLKMDTIAFAETLPDPSDPEKLISDIWLLTMGLEMSEASKDYLLSTVLSGLEKTSYWTNAWNKRKNSMMDQQVVETRLQSLLIAMCQLGEFQLF